MGVVERCVRIAMERTFIEKARELKSWRGAYQAARDIAVIHGLDIDAMDFSDAAQFPVRRLFDEKQQAQAKSGAF